MRPHLCSPHKIFSKIFKNMTKLYLALYENMTILIHFSVQKRSKENETIQELNLLSKKMLLLFCKIKLFKLLSF